MRAKRLLMLWRPWTIRPLLVASLVSGFQLLVISAVLTSLSMATGQISSDASALWMLLMTAISFSVGYSTLLLGSRAMQRWPKFAALIYHLVGAIFAIGAVVGRAAMTNDLTPTYWQEPISNLRLFLVTLLLFYTLHSAIGSANSRISEEARQAQAARVALEIQRGRLIDSQEKTRKQISEFLHDRLQSDLVVLGIQMNRAVAALPSESRGVFKAFVDEVERIREVGVREVSKALAPELQNQSLRSAIDYLIRQYAQVAKVEVAVQENAALTEQQRLAVYRIVEQALLNAAKHAEPTSLRIAITFSAHAIDIAVENDGHPLPEAITAGSGFAIIETWVSQFEGNWNISSAGDHTILAARLEI